MVSYTKKYSNDCKIGHKFYEYKKILIYTVVKEYALTYIYTIIDVNKNRIIPEIDIRSLEGYKGIDNVCIYLHREKYVPEIILKALKNGELTDEMWVKIDELENYVRKALRI